MNTYNWAVESLVIENNGKIEAWVYPDYEYIDEQTTGSSRADRKMYIEKLLDDVRVELNTQLPRTSRLANVYERREPFIKTATHKIKRYLYGEHAVLR